MPLKTNEYRSAAELTLVPAETPEPVPEPA